MVHNQEVNIDQKEKSSSRRELRAASRAPLAACLLLRAALHHQLGTTQEPKPDTNSMDRDDWDRLLEITACHEIRPALYDWLKEQDGVPENVIDDLKQTVLNNGLVQLRNLRELVNLGNVMAERSIPFAAYKGLAFADAFCRSVNDRESIDLDIFTDAGKLSEIRDILLAQSYIEQADQQRYSDRYFQRVAGEWSFEKYEGEERSFLVDVHWRPAMRHYHFDLTYRDLAGRIRERQLAGQSFLSLDASALCLLTLIHHGGIVFWHKLKYVQDLALVLRHYEEIDWDWVLGYIHKFEFYRSFLAGLLLAEKYTGVPVPERFLKDSDQARIRSLAALTEAWYERYPDRISAGKMVRFGWRYRLASRDRFSRRLRMLRDLGVHALIFRGLAPVWFQWFPGRRGSLFSGIKTME